MPVYVDDMYRYPMGQFGRMKMSHMIADTEAELNAMADKIGVARKWIQYPGTAKVHFDIAQVKRTLAIQRGAIPITWHQCGVMAIAQRATGVLMPPALAELWYSLRDDPNRDLFF